MKKIVALALCLVLALSLCATAMAAEAETPVLTNQTVKGTGEGDAKATGTNVFFVKAADIDTNDDDEITAKGNVAYYTLSATAYTKKYVAVGSKAEADVVVYSDEDCKNVSLYLDEVVPEYVPATVFADFGKKCGQIKYSAQDKTKTYYLVKDYAIDQTAAEKLYVAASAGTESVMVDGKLVRVNGVDGWTRVDHAATPVVTDGKLTGYKCATCGVAAVKAANYASIPSGAQIVNGSDGEYYYFAAAAASTTAAVSSAKTFDAGIAMYVGMSIMAVTGSAVVIGKKKEF